MNPFQQIVIRIIKEQELIIGPLSWEEAKKVSGLTISVDKSNVSFIGPEKDVIDKLVNQYERLFGQASREACRDAVASILPEMKQAQIPSSLR